MITYKHLKRAPLRRSSCARKEKERMQNIHPLADRRQEEKKKGEKKTGVKGNVVRRGILPVEPIGKGEKRGGGGAAMPLTSGGKKEENHGGAVSRPIGKLRRRQ